jgi:hypothetical protein
MNLESMNILFRHQKKGEKEKEVFLNGEVTELKRVAGFG